jgi:hypothetical protein
MRPTRHRMSVPRAECGPQKFRPRCKMMEMLSLTSFGFFSADCRNPGTTVRPDLHIDLDLCHPATMVRLARSVSHSLRSFVRLAGDLTLDGFHFLGATVRSRSAVSAEILFLRKQLAFYQEHQIRSRRLTDSARFSLALWSHFFDWKEALVIVKPETLIGWHRKGFKIFWKWKCWIGRPRLPWNIRQLIVSHGARESDLGRRASGCGVVGETSDFGLPANGSVLLAVAVLSPSHQKDFVPTLEDICPQSCGVPRGL